MDLADPDVLLAGLDDAQRQAVTTPTLPLCVLAGAGSGKTRVLTRRIAWRCATGLDDPRRVLALTFTRAAAAELTTRLRALGVREGVRAGTFHAVAWADLRARAAEQGRPAPVLLERPMRVLARAADDLDRDSLAAVEAELAWSRARSIPLDRYPTEAAFAGRRPGVAPERVVAIGAAYATEKRRRGAVDFDDLLEQAASAMAADPAHAAAQRWRAAHLYVDEFQDLNPLQHRLLEEWRGGRDVLTAVGDPNQAIYGWNGSDPGFLEQFTELHPGAAVVAVDRNYRSSAPIVAVANRVLDAGALGGVRLHAVRGEGPAPVVSGYADADEEAVAVARAVLDARMPGTRWGRHAVLARTNALLAPIEEALRAVGIPVRGRDRVSFVDQPIVRAVLRSLPDSPSGFREALAAATSDSLDEQLPTDRDDGEPALLAELAELGERYLATADRVDAAGFRSWLLDATDARGGDGVDLATFHAAKGREWPTVHLVGVEEGLVPLRRARTDDALAEERRLFYVACTRAEDELRITYAARRPIGGVEAERRPSPFLAELVPVLEDIRRAAAPARPTAVPPALRPSTNGADDHAAERSREDALRAWRATRARASGISPTEVLTDATLAAVAAAAPTTADDLASIPGARPLVLAGFADEVLDSLRG
jgi:DNA helicase-2/ATP-dependent DNA helicase PcrA